MNNRAYGITIFVVSLALAGLALHRNAVWQDEVRTWEDTLRKSPGKDRTYYSLGCSYAKQGRFAAAVAMFDRAVALSPHYYAAYQKRGNAYDDMGMVDRAFADYDRVIRMAPEYAEVYYDRGLAYERMNQFKDAQADYQRGCERGDSLACEALRKRKF
jgi:tetratricopeptide (TPR) repeat protein